MEQIDAELAKLCAEDEWREEYVALWEQQRKRPRSEFEDESVTAAPPVNGKKVASCISIIPGSSMHDAHTVSVHSISDLLNLLH